MPAVKRSSKKTSRRVSKKMSKKMGSKNRKLSGGARRRVSKKKSKRSSKCKTMKSRSRKMRGGDPGGVKVHPMPQPVKTGPASPPPPQSPPIDPKIKKYNDTMEDIKRRGLTGLAYEQAAAAAWHELHPY